MVRLELVETTGDGRRAATLLGFGALFATICLIDILCARLSDLWPAALTDLCQYFGHKNLRFLSCIV